MFLAHKNLLPFLETFSENSYSQNEGTFLLGDKICSEFTQLYLTQQKNQRLIKGMARLLQLIVTISKFTLPTPPKIRTLTKLPSNLKSINKRSSILKRKSIRKHKDS